MPKKFKGENSKAAEARARLEEKRALEKAKIDKEKEDEVWQDNDKNILKKNQRKDLLEKKKLEQQERKLEKQKLYEEEVDKIKGPSHAKIPVKVTKMQIHSEKEKENKLLIEKAIKPHNIIEQITLETNLNKQIDLLSQARNVEEALSILSTEDTVLDSHPERRMKAAYAAFENENLERLKAENSNMRLSQLKQLLKKEWMKSPQNPMNQAA